MQLSITNTQTGNSDRKIGSFSLVLHTRGPCTCSLYKSNSLPPRLVPTQALLPPARLSLSLLRPPVLRIPQVEQQEIAPIAGPRHLVVQAIHPGPFVVAVRSSLKEGVRGQDQHAVLPLTFLLLFPFLHEPFCL